MYGIYKNWQIPEMAEVQGAKKALPYTIIPIGNKEDLLKWRKDQALMAEARDAYLRPIRQATRDRVVALVANQNAITAPDEVSKAELTHLKARTTKQAYKPHHEAPRASNEVPRKGLWASAKDLVAGIWRNAFPDSE